MRKEKANPQKNTLLKNAQANAESNFFKRVFFSPTLRFFNYLFFQRTVRNRTDIASNVNRFEQSVCGLQTVVLRTNSRTAANISSCCATPAKNLVTNPQSVF